MPNKASPEVMRQATVIAHELIIAGIDFVPMPVVDAAHKADLIKQADVALDLLCANAIQEELDDECK